MALDKIKMSQQHEQFLAELTGGKKTRGSGSQWTDQMDSRAHRFDVLFAVASDGKATLGQSITVSRAMLEKAIRQAAGERPLIGLRFYSSERLDIAQEWVAIRADDFGELLDKVNNPPALLTPGHEMNDEQLEAWRAQFDQLNLDDPGAVQPISDEAEHLKQRVVEQQDVIDDQMSTIRQLGERPTQEAHRLLMGQFAQAQVARQSAEALAGAMKEQIASAQAADPLALAAEIGRLQQQAAFQAQIIAGQRTRLQAVEGRHSDLAHLMSEPPPKLPWTVVFKETRGDGQPHVRILNYDEVGAMSESEAHSDVRVEPMASGGSQMIVNGTRVKQGDLYISGRRVARVGEE